MPLLDFWKKTKKGPKAPQQGKKVAASKRNELRTDASVQEEKKASKTEIKKVVLKESKTAWRILREPHVTEKATDLTHLNQYAFKVFNNPSKPEIKKAVEQVYGVEVEKVRKISIKGKTRRRGRHIGWKPGYKKAVVTLKKGDKIEVLPH